MMESLLPKGELLSALREWSKNFLLLSPQREGSSFSFKKLVHFDDVVVNYSTTLLPPLKALLPLGQTLFAFEEGEIKDHGVQPEEILLFGVHLEDLEAILKLKEIHQSPTKDLPLLDFIERLTIVGVDYPEHPEAFFKRETEKLKPLCDLFLDDVGEGYLANAFSSKGKALIEGKFWQKVKEPKAPRRERINRLSLLENPHKLKRAVENKNHPIWEEMAKKCLGCGVCTWVCPLCYCFKTEDRLSLDSKEGRREKRWASCLLPDFHTIAGGYCFKPELKERFYAWYHHKFVRMMEEYGFPGCVGCGRCSIYCPAGINIWKVLSELEGLGSRV